MRLQTGDESYILSSGLNDAQINQIEQPRIKYLRPEEKHGSLSHLLINRSHILKQDDF